MSPRTSHPVSLATITALAALLAACGESVTAARIFVDLDPGVQVDQVRVEVQLAGATLVSEVTPAQPRVFKTGDDFVILFDDRLGGQSVDLIIAGLLGGAETSRGTGSVKLAVGQTVSTFVTLLAATSCPPGQHACNGSCYADADTNHCGLSCRACTVSGTGTVGCVDGQCEITCGTGFTKCGLNCVDLDNDPNNCGGCTHKCPSGQVCRGRICSANSCADGQHPCNDLCVSNQDVRTCGYSCTPCPTPTHGSATCDGIACGIHCETGFQNCGNGLCSDIGAPDTCGVTCIKCPTPTAHGHAYCNGESCGIACDSGYQQCGTECKPNTQPCGATGCGTCASGTYCYAASGTCYTPGVCGTNAECPEGVCLSMCLCAASTCRPYEVCQSGLCVAGG
ncbi:MAG TPA: hypothetical protein VGQ83_04455 [Polyangia bacterium]|jgi:hypothetical protein